MRMPTVADRLAERFVRPLSIDRIRALVEPAVAEVRQGGKIPKFELLEEETELLTREPTGVGLDVPAWLVALEEEVEHVLRPMHERRRDEDLAALFPPSPSPSAKPASNSKSGPAGRSKRVYRFERLGRVVFSLLCFAFFPSRNSAINSSTVGSPSNASRSFVYLPHTSGKLVQKTSRVSRTDLSAENPDRLSGDLRERLRCNGHSASSWASSKGVITITLKSD